MSKNFEHLIHQQLTVNLEKIFHNSMFGHRKCHGCLMALHAFTEQWKEDLDNHNIMGTIAIDLSKAFDCVPHDIILEKLKFYGLSDHQSEVHHVSVLRATLFKIFKNDLAYAITQCRIVKGPFAAEQSCDT